MLALALSAFVAAWSPSAPAPVLHEPPAEKLCAVEIDLVPAGTSFAIAALPDYPLMEFSEELARRGFNAVVAWLPAGEPVARDWVMEPTAGRLAVAELPEGPLRSALREWSPDVALCFGRRAEPVDGDDLAVARFRSTPIWDSPLRSAAVRWRALGTLPHIERPTVTTMPWCDPEFGRREVPESGRRGFLLSTRPLEVVPALRRREQWGYDLDAFQPAWPRPVVEDSLAKASVAATAIATMLAGDQLSQLAPFENEWRGDGSDRPRSPQPLRRGAPFLDLEEWLFSANANGMSLVDRLETEQSEWFIPAEFRKTAFARLWYARSRAARHHGRFMALGDEPERVAALVEIDAQERLLSELPELASAWRAGLAADRELVKAATPWRCHRTKFELLLRRRDPAGGGQIVPLPPVEIFQFDDPRLGDWEHTVASAFRARFIDRNATGSFGSGETLVARATLPLRDPRNLRLELAGDGRATVTLNGVPIVVDQEIGANPLLTTLPLASGTNELRLEVTPRDRFRSLHPRLTLLPHRLEGSTFVPRQALRVHEPAVVLRDPNALGEESLVWPESRIGAAGAGSADFSFTPEIEQRFDLWVHALVPATIPACAIGVDDPPSQVLRAPTGGWQWLRAPAPVLLTAIAHRVHVELLTPDARIDALTLLPTGTAFPRPPAGDGWLADSAWRFDPLGTGLVVDLPPLTTGDHFGRSFTAERTGSYAIFGWLRGREPLRPGEVAEIDVTSPAGRNRFVLPAGVSYEEWIPFGRVNFNAGDHIEIRARGKGGVARLAFVQ